MQSVWKGLLLLFAVAASGVNAASKPLSTLDVLAQMPECARTPVLDAVTASTCLPTNLTCVCLNEELQAAAATWIQGNCTVKQSLFTMNLTQTTCGAPVRDARRSYIILNDVYGVLIGVSVLQRIGAKLYWKLGIEADDWCILLTTIFLVVPSLAINVHALIANGMGLDIWTVPFDQITRFSTWFHAMSVLYFTQISLIKLTLLLFYLRVFPVTKVRYIVIGTIIFNCLYGFIYAMVTIFQCLPVGYLSHRWDHEHKGKCINLNAMTWSNAGISIAVDIWMLLIPLMQVKTLQLDSKKKIGAALMFCVGTAFTIISIVRLRVLVRFGYTENPTWTYIEISKWSTSEIAVGIICVCMPSYRLLLVRLFPRAFGSRHQFTPNDSSNAHSYAKSGASGDKSFATSQVSSATHTRSDSRAVRPQRSYGIEYVDVDHILEDETTLVHMKEVEPKSWSEGPGNSV